VNPRVLRGGRGLLLIMTGLALGLAAAAAPVKVELRQTGERWELLRAGQPYHIAGAGGVDHLERLAAAGANSLRTWGTDQTEAVIDEAGRLGLSVTAGLWIEHERNGFNYDDPVAVAAQIRRHCAAVDRFKDHPALLLWSVGNEVETHATNPKVWDTIEAVAAYIKRVDPAHPVMVVTAHVSLETVAAIKQRCPSVDLLGCNSYQGLLVLAADVRRSGWTGPYLVTEWGADGSWEVAKTPWRAELEPTSTEKAFQFALRYPLILRDADRCLGSYAFYWGQKQETTATWFNLFTEAGAETESVEVLQALWSAGRTPLLAPRITPLLVNGVPAAAGLRVAAGAKLRAEFALARGEPAGLRAHWELAPESSDKRIGGDREIRPEAYALPVPSGDLRQLEFTAPTVPGAYRLFLTVTGPANRAATANFPFLVE